MREMGLLFVLSFARFSQSNCNGQGSMGSLPRATLLVVQLHPIAANKYELQPPSTSFATEPRRSTLKDGYEGSERQRSRQYIARCLWWLRQAQPHGISVKIQSFWSAHRCRVCVPAFIGVSVCTHLWASPFCNGFSQKERGAFGLFIEFWSVFQKYSM